jgi:hypothetical protein
MEKPSSRKISQRLVPNDINYTDVWLFTATLLVAKTRPYLEQLNKLWHIHTMESYAAIFKNENAF